MAPFCDQDKDHFFQRAPEQVGEFSRSSCENSCQCRGDSLE